MIPNTYIKIGYNQVELNMPVHILKHLKTCFEEFWPTTSDGDKRYIIIGQKLGRVDDKVWPKPTQGHKNNEPQRKNLWSDLVLCKSATCSPFLPALKNTLLLGPLTPFLFSRESFLLWYLFLQQFDTTKAWGKILQMWSM